MIGAGYHSNTRTTGKENKFNPDKKP